MSKHYDYIITGAGCAGMSLLMRMIQEPFFSSKSILILDRSAKSDNDRTWCFWEKEEGLFEPLVIHQWKQMGFYEHSFSATLDISPFTYKMIRGIDLYNHVKQAASGCSNIEWRQDEVTSIKNRGGKVVVTTAVESFTADWVFNSILFRGQPDTSIAGNYYLLQHFMGWLIETGTEAFDPGNATFMDFRINQDRGTQFMYILPVSRTAALVEYTLFTEHLLTADEYEKTLKAYIKDILKMDEYDITHREQGVIPMTNYRFPMQDKRIVYMGTAGGQVKGSSGYAFSFIQQRTMDIVSKLKSGNENFAGRSFRQRKFHLYDSVLLNVLHHEKMKGAEIFSAIFRHNPAGRVFRFLDNASNLYEDFQIMRSVPARVFLPAALHELLHW